MPIAREVYLVDAVRTPIAKFRGGLAAVRPDDLAAHVVVALGKRNPALYEQLDQVSFGATNQAGEDNRDVARMARPPRGAPVRGARRHVESPLRLGPRGRRDAVRRVGDGRSGRGDRAAASRA